MLSSLKPRQAFDKAQTEGDSSSNLTIISVIRLQRGGIDAALDVPKVDVLAVDIEVEDADELLSDFDMSAADSVESDDEIIAALDAHDPRDNVVAPDPVAPVANWLADVRELARRHGPFSAAQTLLIIRELNAVDDPAVQAGR